MGLFRSLAVGTGGFNSVAPREGDAAEVLSVLELSADRML
jgi:hypothetical protein